VSDAFNVHGSLTSEDATAEKAQEATKTRNTGEEAQQTMEVEENAADEQEEADGDGEEATARGEEVELRVPPVEAPQEDLTSDALNSSASNGKHDAKDAAAATGGSEANTQGEGTARGSKRGSDPHGVYAKRQRVAQPADDQSSGGTTAAGAGTDKEPGANKELDRLVNDTNDTFTVDRNVSKAKEPAKDAAAAAADGPEENTHTDGDARASKRGSEVGENGAAKAKRLRAGTDSSEGSSHPQSMSGVASEDSALKDPQATAEKPRHLRQAAAAAPAPAPPSTQAPAVAAPPPPTLHARLLRLEEFATREGFGSFGPDSPHLQRVKQLEMAMHGEESSGGMLLRITALERDVLGHS